MLLRAMSTKNCPHFRCGLPLAVSLPPAPTRAPAGRITVRGLSPTLTDCCALARFHSFPFSYRFEYIPLPVRVRHNINNNTYRVSRANTPSHPLPRLSPPMTDSIVEQADIGGWSWKPGPYSNFLQSFFISFFTIFFLSSFLFCIIPILSSFHIYLHSYGISSDCYITCSPPIFLA